MPGRAADRVSPVGGVEFSAFHRYGLLVLGEDLGPDVAGFVGIRAGSERYAFTVHVLVGWQHAGVDWSPNVPGPDAPSASSLAGGIRLDARLSDHIAGWVGVDFGKLWGKRLGDACGQENYCDDFEGRIFEQSFGVSWIAGRFTIGPFVAVREAAEDGWIRFGLTAAAGLF